MSEPYRVAVYAAPGSGKDPYGAALLERAEAWLGRAVDGRPVAAGTPGGWTREAVDTLTVEARRYGFHGTLKAPFRLAEGRSLAEFDDAVAGFAAGRADVLIPRLALTRMGRFFALTPGVDAAPLYALADAAVTVLDGFRASLTKTELARRKPETLTHRQRELLARWGYPYVFDQFRFHLTVTDQIQPERQDEVETVLRDWFADSLNRDIAVDVVAIFVEPGPGAPFELHATYPLRTHPDPARTDLHTDIHPARAIDGTAREASA